jgi:hypothetical protein
VETVSEVEKGEACYERIKYLLHKTVSDATRVPFSVWYVVTGHTFVSLVALHDVEIWIDRADLCFKCKNL